MTAGAAAMDELSMNTASTMVALGQTMLSASGLASSGPEGAQPSGPRRFTNTGTLGAGGMGVVSGAWDGDLLRELAIKRVRPELRAESAAIELLLWEARVTAYLDHPNIVTVHDLGTTDGGDPYFTMKRVAGVSLERVLAGLRAGDARITAQWSPARRLRMLLQVCLAVSFAHRRGVLHRDLKPANVMLGDAGEVVVMDWGLAVPLAGPAGERLRRVMPRGMDTASAGTPLYMSPEQARCEPLDERSDVYALGIILYELITLARPYEGETATEVLLRISNGCTRPLGAARPRVPAPLVAIIECAIAPHREGRYASVTALADDLECYLDGGTPVAERARPVTQLVRFYFKHDRRLAQLRVFHIDMLGCAAMALGLALGVVFADRIGSRWWIAGVIAVLAAIPPIRGWQHAMKGADHADR